MTIMDKRRIKSAFRFLARRRWAHLAAYLLLWSSRSALPSPTGTKKDQRPCCALVLSVNKSGFLQDVEECFLEANNFQVIRWPTFALNTFASAILDPSLNNNTYLSNEPAIEATKREYRQFLSEMWRHFLKLRPVDVVLSPNFHYFVQREFAEALEEAGTPFVVLHKENLKSPGRVEFWRVMYEKRGTFGGRKILVYNDIERQLQISTGVIEPQKIVITGTPRLDKFHRWRQAHANSANGRGRPQVLFFAFDRGDKLPALQLKETAAQRDIPDFDDRWGKMSWKCLCEETHSSIVEIARRRPDVHVVVKTKGISRQANEILELLQPEGEPLPPNLEIVWGGDSYPLIINSDVIVGFNTTAQLEAIAAGKPVVMPWFAEALEPKTREFAIDLGEAVEYAHSPEEIVGLVCRHLDGANGVPQVLTPGAAEVLRRWTGNDDGASGRRVFQAVCSEIDSGKHDEAASTVSHAGLTGNTAPMSAAPTD